MADMGSDPQSAILLDGKIRLVPTQTIVDARGWLCPVDFSPLAFVPVRAFAVSAPDAVTRGRHAHRKCRQIFMQVSGRIVVDFSDGRDRGQIQLDASNRVLLVEALVWTKQTFFGDNATLLVFADGPYDPTDYIHDETELRT